MKSGSLLSWTLLAVLVNDAVCMSQEEVEEADMEDERLAVNGAGVPHQFGCSDEGIWKGSCDIAQDYSIVQPAKWSNECDTWRVFVRADDATNGNVTFTSKNWTCPEKYRSPSGCGDFRTDPRGKTCAATAKIDMSLQCVERIVITAAEPLLPQKHVCVQRPIFFENVNTAGKVTPPILGRHRNFWAKWGEYEYLPPQRWTHNSEHGGAIFLYDPCLDEESICLLRRYIKKWQLSMNENTPGGKFRFILTPFKDLSRPFAISMWGELFMSKCFNEAEMDAFVTRNYRKAWEDFGSDGKYSHLYVDIDDKLAQCSGAMTFSPQQKWAITHPTGAFRAVSMEDFQALKEEQADLRFLTRISVGANVACVLGLCAAAVLVTRWSRRFKVSESKVYESAESA